VVDGCRSKAGVKTNDTIKTPCIEENHTENAGKEERLR
jgi:hypothetical protein